MTAPAASVANTRLVTRLFLTNRGSNLHLQRTALTSEFPALARGSILQARCSASRTGSLPRRLHRTPWHRVLIAALALPTLYCFQNAVEIYAEAPTSRHEDSRIFSLDEIRQHDASAKRQWVIKGNRVYDITDWIPSHPGGEVILRAAGGAVDAYWDIFTIHKKPEVYETLEMYYIGDVAPDDLTNGKVATDKIEDPFRTDPERDPSLIVHSQKPFNAETQPEDLEPFITPNSKFYVRNHLWTPAGDEPSHTLRVELPSGDEKAYTLTDLQTKFPTITITASLQCCGNRRRHMSSSSRSTQGLPWSVGGISTATWTGVRLRDILSDAGLNVTDPDPSAQHVQFTGAEAYGASIPLDKAVSRSGDTILAFAMNGAPLPRDHGFPLRAIVPGTTAARSVKWLSGIRVSDEESQSQWQQRDYKCFGPNQGPEDVDWASAPAIQETPVQSAITCVREISAHESHERERLRVYGLEEDAIRVTGYAISGGGRRIVRVDVSADDGRTWDQAVLLAAPGGDEGIGIGAVGEKGKRKGLPAGGGKAWAWTRWEWIVPKRLAGRVFVVKAVDEAYNVQPDSFEAQYNFRGMLANAWHRVKYERVDE